MVFFSFISVSFSFLSIQFAGVAISHRMSNQSAAEIRYENDISDATLNETRYVIQRILIPCIVSIGIAGNLLTVVVLTR